jgi:hypothetical protein
MLKPGKVGFTSDFGGYFIEQAVDQRLEDRDDDDVREKKHRRQYKHRNTPLVRQNSFHKRTSHRQKIEKAGVTV